MGITYLIVSSVTMETNKTPKWGRRTSECKNLRMAFIHLVDIGKENHLIVSETHKSTVTWHSKQGNSSDAKQRVSNFPDMDVSSPRIWYQVQYIN